MNLVTLVTLTPNCVSTLHQTQRATVQPNQRYRPSMKSTYRSDRLTNQLASCTMTPRSGKRYVEKVLTSNRIAVSDPAEFVYSEAKLALCRQDFNTATLLFSQCPPDYKRTARYQDQCSTYRQLTNAGVVQNAQIAPIASFFSKVFEVSNDNITYQKYAAAAYNEGWSLETLESLQLIHVDELSESCGMRAGHYAKLIEFAAINTDNLTKMLYYFSKAAERCVGVSVCLSHTLKSGKAAFAEA